MAFTVAALAYVLRPPSGAVAPRAASPPALCTRVATRARLLDSATASQDSTNAAPVHTCPQCGQPHASRNQLYAHLRANYATCGEASGLDLATGAPVRLRKHVLSVGYGACGGAAAAALIRQELAALEGVPLHAMTRASDWRFRRSPLLRQQENVPAAADVIVYSAATAVDEAERVGEVAESIGAVAGGAGRRSPTCRLARLNAALAPHGAAVFEWQAVSQTGQQLHAERDCTARTYECLLPFEYLSGTEEGANPNPNPNPSPNPNPNQAGAPAARLARSRGSRP